MSPHPIMKIFNVGDSINYATWSEDIGVFCKQSWRDDASLVLARLEMGIWEEEEESRKRMLCEVVGHELHGVCADYGHVLVRAGKGRILWDGSRAKGDDSVMDVL